MCQRRNSSKKKKKSHQHRKRKIACVALALDRVDYMTLASYRVCRLPLGKSCKGGNVWGPKTISLHSWRNIVARAKLMQGNGGRAANYCSFAARFKAAPYHSPRDFAAHIDLSTVKILPCKLIILPATQTKRTICTIFHVQI